MPAPIMAWMTSGRATNGVEAVVSLILTLTATFSAVTAVILFTVVHRSNSVYSGVSEGTDIRG